MIEFALSSHMESRFVLDIRAEAGEGTFESVIADTRRQLFGDTRNLIASAVEGLREGAGAQSLDVIVTPGSCRCATGERADPAPARQAAASQPSSRSPCGWIAAR